AGSPPCRYTALFRSLGHDGGGGGTGETVRDVDRGGQAEKCGDVRDGSAMVAVGRGHQPRPRAAEPLPEPVQRQCVDLPEPGGQGTGDRIGGAEDLEGRQAETGGLVLEEHRAHTECVGHRRQRCQRCWCVAGQRAMECPRLTSQRRGLPGSSGRIRIPVRLLAAVSSWSHAASSASRSTVLASTVTPAAQSSGVEYSRGLWLMPSCWPRTNTIAVGAIASISWASCPAPDMSRTSWRPSSEATSAIVSWTRSSNTTRWVFAIRSVSTRRPAAGWRPGRPARKAARSRSASAI